MLSKKLHLKPGMRVALANAPAAFSLRDLPAGVIQVKRLAPDLDVVLLFATTQKELKAQWPKALAAVKQAGALWVSYPKKSSGIETDLGMGEWDVGQDTGWNPVAMVAIDDTWSAVRFRHAPGLDAVRQARQRESIRDSDGTVCVDRVKRIVTPPRDLQARLAKSSAARQAFAELSFSHRKEYVVWILEAKKPETRSARVAKTVEMLAAGKKNPSAK
jgi:hypothetical protein